MPSHDHVTPSINPTLAPFSLAPGGSYGFNAATTTTHASGGNGSHNNMPPYMLLVKIIYVGV
jgi:hypothetical protein